MIPEEPWNFTDKSPSLEVSVKVRVEEAQDGQCSAQGHLEHEAWTKGAAEWMTVYEVPLPQQRADSALLSAANQHSSLPPLSTLLSHSSLLLLCLLLCLSF